jgi:hypothetical protein
MFVAGELYSHCSTYGPWGRIVCSRNGRSSRLSSSNIGGSFCLSILPSLGLFLVGGFLVGRVPGLRGTVRAGKGAVRLGRVHLKEV